jgi:hypothetical protein
MNIPREWELLIAGARLRPAGRDFRHLEKELTSSGVNWDRVVNQALRHDIAPLIYRNGRDLRKTGPAAAAFEKLRAAYLANAARNALLFQELQKVLETFREHTKSTIVLKGAALAEMVYRDRALRPMADLDLLVRQQDLIEIEEILNALEYTLDEKQQSTREWCFEHHYRLAFVKRVCSSVVIRCEIHWHLDRPALPFAIDTEGVWKRATAARIAGVPALILSAEDLLLHLCLHTCKHGLIGVFRAFCDIAEVVRRFRQDLYWEQVVSRASGWRANQFIYVPLRIAQQLLGADVPETIMKALVPDDFDDRLVEAAITHLLEDRRKSAVSPRVFLLRHANSVSNKITVGRKFLPRDASEKRNDPVIEQGTEPWRFLRLGRRTAGKAADWSQLSEWLAPFGYEDS